MLVYFGKCFTESFVLELLLVAVKLSGELKLIDYLASFLAMINLGHVIM